MAEHGPFLVPFNCAVSGERIYFRIARASGVGRNADGQPMGFEVQSTDEENGVGWSMLARGTARKLPK